MTSILYAAGRQAGLRNNLRYLDPTTFTLIARRGASTLGGSLYTCVKPRVQFLGEWRNVSLGQSIYSYEAFGVQQFTMGLRIAR